MGTRTTRIRRTNADFNLLDADDTDDADFLSCAIHTGISHRRKKESASSVSERLLARRRRTLLQRYAGKLSFFCYKPFHSFRIVRLKFSIPIRINEARINIRMSIGKTFRFFQSHYHECSGISISAHTVFGYYSGR